MKMYVKIMIIDIQKCLKKIKMSFIIYFDLECLLK